MKKNLNKSERIAQDIKHAECIDTHFSKTHVFHYAGGQSMKAADAVKAYRAHADLAKRTSAAHAQWLSLVEEERRTAAELRKLTSGINVFITNAYGPSSAVAIDFGSAEPKVTAPSADVRALAVKKSAATRKARHTMGKKERLAIHGVVEQEAATGVAAQVAAPADPQAVAASPAVNGAPAPAIANGANGVNGTSGVNGAAH
jgi:hypothetical protein